MQIYSRIMVRKVIRSVLAGVSFVSMCGWVINKRMGKISSYCTRSQYLFLSR